MKEQLTAEKQAVIALYNSEKKSGRELMERIFGVSAFKPRPIDVWCLGTDGAMVKPEEWDSSYESQGVLVVTEETAFIVAPHASVALQWGALGKAKSDLVTDKETFDSKAATDAMIAAYAGTHYEDNDGKIWDVYGAPAAEWCRAYSHGSIGAGGWDLPTIAQLKAMHAHRDEINECLMAIRGYRLAPGAYWSSIGNDTRSAWYVGMNDGYTDWFNKDGRDNVRAVSAFQI